MSEYGKMAFWTVGLLLLKAHSKKLLGMAPQIEIAKLKAPDEAEMTQQEVKLNC